VNVLGRLSVFPTIPERIARLHELAYNLWFAWNADAQALYAAIDPALWAACEHNPVRVLAAVSPERLTTLAEDGEFLGRYDWVLAQFDAYMHPESTWYGRAHGDTATRTIAYFSAEFGLHESLPIYSGGLGILSGDHCKEASDLGMPLVGIGFLYPQGYFRQRITASGAQEAIYEKLNFSNMPVRAATDASGQELMVSVDLPGRTVFAKVWRLQVGRIPLFLMDTDVAPNAPADRTLSARLYGGDHEMRIAQEIMLGIGGVRALRALGVDPQVWHMNEGHSAFMGLERCRELVQGAGLSFQEACEVEAANAIFTTHTPVAAGNDVFGVDLVERYLRDFWPQLGIDRETFLNFAREDFEWGQGFSMTVLALRLSAQHNGVSRLHGAVSRQMWRFLWPGVEASEVPISSITNGVHTATWLAPELAPLYAQYLGADWYDHLDEPARWEGVAHIPDADLWHTHERRKAALIEFARARIARQRTRVGEGGPQVAEAARLLNPEALTLGFARRFATYKRATLLFRDPERLARLLSDPARPVQIIFAGKAHPNDKPGQEFIRQVYEYSRDPRFAGKVVFLEDYDIDMARYLVSGVDVWLNTPIRPHEASGTSGQKASLNGVPNCSIIDGWWEEGYNGANGWAIGEQREYVDGVTRDETDAHALYTMLEESIVPAYYEARLDDVPHQWTAIMKEAIRTLAPAFSMRRMLKDYTEQLYQPALRLGQQMDADHFQLACNLAAWKQRVTAAWDGVSIRAVGPLEGQVAVGQTTPVEAFVRLGTLAPEDVEVALVAALDENGTLRALHSVPMRPDEPTGAGELRYLAELSADANGSLVYGVRVRPSHPGLAHPFAMGLARWA
jgi:glycogen phosphorylase